MFKSAPNSVHHRTKVARLTSFHSLPFKQLDQKHSPKLPQPQVTTTGDRMFMSKSEELDDHSYLRNWETNQRTSLTQQIRAAGIYDLFSNLANENSSHTQAEPVGIDSKIKLDWFKKHTSKSNVSQAMYSFLVSVRLLLVESETFNKGNFFFF